MSIMSKDCNKNQNLFGKHPRQKENKEKYEGMTIKILKDNGYTARIETGMNGG